MSWQKSGKTKIEYVLDNKIKNLHPDLREKIILDFDSISSDLSIKKLEKLIRTKLNLSEAPHKSYTPRIFQYWTLRGWSETEAYYKRHKQSNVSCYSREFWLARINPITNNFYTEIEADFERNSRRPIRKEYWIKQGFSEEDAITKANITKHNNNKNGAKSQPESKFISKVTSKRCKEYYLVRGYSLEESIAEVSKNQMTFSKDICISKHGLEKGTEIWNNRQLKWRKSLIDSGIYLGVSRSSLLLFDAISKTINHIKYGKDEITITCENNTYSVDCLDFKTNKIIEYFGDYWHGNPRKFSPDSKIKKGTAQEVWAKDLKRINTLISAGYEVLIVWEHDVTKNFNETLTKCITFLTQQNEK